MKYGINKVTLVGNVGDQPKINEKNDEIIMATFPFATSETYRDKDNNEVTTTQWHRIKVWGKKAEVIQKYVKKGDSLYIEGKIESNNWEDKDGNKHYNTEIVCNNFLFLRSKIPNEG